MAKKQAVASVSFENICLELPSGEKILEDVTGEFRAGRMCAILGPSGAGKTSLMNVLCGKANYAYVTGRVCFNGQEGNYQEYKTVMGFVPQEDIVHEGLTVGEQIRFSADLRNPKEMAAHRRKLIYEDVLNVMQLSSIQNSIVGGLEKRGISGGQRKRVSIGLELAADPTMLFLDEPTSGLDASSSLAIVHSLKKLAQLGMTSVMVVHQPRWSLFSLFDVLLLGKGGRTVFLGPAQSAAKYFQQLGFEAPLSENPADWIMDIIAGEVPNHRIPHFIPEMLYELWEVNAHVVQRSAKAAAVKEVEKLPLDDWQTMVKNLDEEWSMICYTSAPSAVDPKREGVLREADLLRLLKSIRPKVSEDEEEEEADDMSGAIRQLLARIAGPSALVCTKAEVREFLRGLCGVVAEDKDTVSMRLAEEMVKKKSSQMDVFGKMSTTSSGTSHKTSLREDARAGKVPSAEPTKVRHAVIMEEEEVQQISPRGSPKVRHEARHGAPDPCCSGGGPDREEVETVGQYVRVDTEPVMEKAFPSSVQPPGSTKRFGSNSVQASAGDGAEVRDEEDTGAGIMKERRHYDEITSSKPSLSTVPSSGCTLPLVSSLESMSSPSRVHRPKEFTVLLPPGKPHGLVVATEDGLSLKVRDVGEGRIKDWNAVNTSLQIKKHDHIVQVNHVSIGADAMQAELGKDDAQLEILVRSRDHRKSCGMSSKASSCASDASPSTLLGRVGAGGKDGYANDPAEGMETGPTQLESVIEVRHLESGQTTETKQPNARRNRSFASQYNNLRRIAAEQKPPGFFRQLRVLMKRSFIQWWRGSWQRAIFLGVITGSSAIMATMDAFVVKEAEWQVLPVLNLHTTLALLIAVFSLNLFSTDRPVFWRERESGLSVAAFTVSKMVTNSIDLVLQCFLLASVYFLIRQPVVSFLVFFPPFLLVTIAASGLGYAISTCFPPKHGPFITAICIFVSCGLLGHPLRVETMADGGTLEFVLDVMSITRWTVGYYYLNFLADTDMSLFSSDQEAVEMIAGIEKIYTGPQLVTNEVMGMSSAIVFCIGMGFAWHLVAFLRLMFSNLGRGHRRAAPWKQRLYRFQGWTQDMAARVLGEERQARLAQTLHRMVSHSHSSQ